MAQQRRTTHRSGPGRAGALRGALSQELWEEHDGADRFGLRMLGRPALVAGLDDELDHAARAVPLDRIPSLPPDGVMLPGVRSRSEAVTGR
jgi:hypothetical protein